MEIYVMKKQTISEKKKSNKRMKEMKAVIILLFLIENIYY